MTTPSTTTLRKPRSSPMKPLWAFIPNDLDSNNFYPIYVANPRYGLWDQEPRIVLAPYIQYAPDYTTVTGTRGQGHERRTIPVHIGKRARSFQHMTAEMWEDFERGAEMEFLVNDSLIHYNNPRLTGEINRFRGKTELLSTLTGDDE